MHINKRLDTLLEQSPTLPINYFSKLVLMSDSHRSIGGGADDFAKNQNLYYVAMQHYDREGFTYIELGDGDELWENKRFGDIPREYDHIFELLSDLYRQGRFHMLWGNHDMVKKNARWCRRNLSAMLEERTGRARPLFPGIRVGEGLVLHCEELDEKILLVHGHQADFFNYDLWRLSKFLVRYVWRPMELIGMQDPFSTSRKQTRRLSVEGRLTAWCQSNNRMLVAGHTHKAVFPKQGEPLYFNDGCSVHPRHITALEIEHGCISLVRWIVSTKPSGVLFVDRTVEEGPVELRDFFAACCASP